MLAVAAIVVIVALGGVIALSGRDDQADDMTTIDGDPTVVTGQNLTSAPLAPPPDFGEAFSARGMLHEVPAVGVDTNAIGVEGTDVRRIAALAGAALDEPNAWLDLIDAQDVELAGGVWPLHGLAQPDELAGEFGIAFSDVERYLSADQFIGSSTPEQLALPFDVLKLAQEPAHLIADAGDDQIVDIGDGDDGERRIDARTPVRPIGQPLRLGVDEQRSMISVSRSTTFTHEWLDSATPTLADEPDLATAATVLDADGELYSVWFESFDRSITRLDPERAPLDDMSQPIREEFSTIAVGLSGRGDSQRTTIAYVFADASAAQASVEPLTNLYAPNAAIETGTTNERSTVGDLLTVDAVRAADRTVVVSARTGGRGMNGLRSLLSTPSLFTHHR